MFWEPKNRKALKTKVCCALEAEKHESIEKIRFVVFWKEKKQESNVIIRLLVLWEQKQTQTYKFHRKLISSNVNL